MITKTWGKTESDFTTPQILIKTLKTLHIVKQVKKNTDSDTTVVLPPRFDTSIKTQLRKYSDASVVANDVESARLY